MFNEKCYNKKIDLRIRGTVTPNIETGDFLKASVVKCNVLHMEYWVIKYLENTLNKKVDVIY